jgi:hypothetical protein
VRAAAIALLTVAACGDNLPGPEPGPDLAPAQTMFVIAHFDDDMIFMQPELLAALGGSLITVYVTSGDLARGYRHGDDVFADARAAYGGDWRCGYITAAGLPAHHCRSGEISLVALDMPDGGLEGEATDSLLHLVEGKIEYLPIVSPLGGHATRDDLIAELAEIVTAVGPSQIHALDLAATHGRDHSSHLLSSSFLLWALARTGYTGELRWHRGYNVDPEAPTLAGSDYTAAAAMLGVFDARYFGHADAQEAAWLQRQYFYNRVPAATVDPFTLDAGGHLRAGARCMTAAATLAECADVPEQYWVLDAEGHLWNGLPPDPAADMDYDHVRCLATADSAATCGAGHDVTWSFH